MRCLILPVMLALTALLSIPAFAGGNRWTSLGLADQSVTSVALDAFDPATIYVASTGGFFESTDRGSSWASFGNEQFDCGNASSLFSDAQHPRVLFASSACLGAYPSFLVNGGLYKSTDGGASWSLVLPKGVFLIPAPGSSSIACAGATDFQYAHPYIYSGSVRRTTDDGDTWGTVLGPVTDNPITSIVFAPSDPSIVYAGFAVDAFREPGVGVFQSTDSGSSWAALPDEGLTTNAVIALAVDPDDPERILAAVDTLGLQTSARGIFLSTDGGATWVQSDAGLEAVSPRAILYDAHDSTKVYSATSGGVFRSTDGGQSWLPMNDGLENVTLYTLTFDSAGGTLYAGTSAGIYSLEPAAAFGCVLDANTLCLNGGRFQVQASWTDFQGSSGLASVVPGASSNDSGVMWFFGPDNWELLIKVLNGCGVNGHYWVFGAAATDVAYTIQVTDTQTGEIRTYTNPLGTISPAITDTAAFASCP